MVFSLYKIIHKAYGYYHDNNVYEKLRTQLPQSNEVALTSEFYKTSDSVVIPYMMIHGNSSELGDDGILKDYSKLKKENKNLAGWIRMPGFKKTLNYPVMYGPDNEFYLTRDFYGNNSYAGSVFMDIRNNPAIIDRNIILYGHNAGFVHVR